MVKRLEREKVAVLPTPPTAEPIDWAARRAARGHKPGLPVEPDLQAQLVQSVWSNYTTQENQPVIEGSGIIFTGLEKSPNL